MPIPDPHLDQLLRTAIEQTRLLRLRYRNQDRIVEPHDYGEHNGRNKLLTYQVDGSSNGPLPNWRWMETDLISDAELLDRTFPGGRPTSSGKHHKWNELFLRVKPARKKKKYTSTPLTHFCRKDKRVLSVSVRSSPGSPFLRLRQNA